MPIVFFLILAGVWAVFLLPQLFDGRKSAPSGSLRNLERSTVLANIAAPGGLEAIARRRTMNRRRRALVSLGLAAIGLLGAAIVFNSTTWLTAAFVADFALAGYVTMLLSMREQRYRTAKKVVPMPTPQYTVTAPVRLEEQSATVRVVAG
jgi:cyanate permease